MEKINTEIERRWFIKKPRAGQLTVRASKDIIQTYLVSVNGYQRRVRRITENGAERFFYTEKRFISGFTREENEREITPPEYESLIQERDPQLNPVIKTRLVTDYEGLVFEIDEYDFSPDFAIMEAELISEEQSVQLPPQIETIREVTGDRSYSNATVAKNRAFPKP